ncbi:DMT family transporter [Demetria terragena]|uniref:DMT family transporter n=1 Tax=Demetria terragena TaxID=63959 RepID=UPI000366D999|nr:EamA family transporter [Demetria terragena]
MLALLALGSSVVWGTSDFLGGLLTKRIPALLVVASSQIFGLSATIVMVLISGDQRWGGWLPAILAGAVGSIGLAAFYTALSSGAMGVVSPIAALSAVVPVALGLATGDPMGAALGIGIACAIGGCVLAAGPEISGGVGARPVAYAVLAACCFGLTLFFIDRASEVAVAPSLMMMRSADLVVLGVLITVVRARGALGSGRPMRSDIPMLAVIGLGDLGANALYGLATAYGAVSVAAVLGSLFPVMTLLLARFVLHERMRRIQLVGVALAVVGVVLVSGGS